MGRPDRKVDAKAVPTTETNQKAGAAAAATSTEQKSKADTKKAGKTNQKKRR